ncbi:hypothetical protein GBA52_023485 [Prunus armeniaca]|nr:hypothetical protein GBA52_023485 [Prunus armeniaca]
MRGSIACAAHGLVWPSPSRGHLLPNNLWPQPQKSSNSEMCPMLASSSRLMRLIVVASINNGQMGII